MTQPQPLSSQPDPAEAIPTAPAAPGPQPWAARLGIVTASLGSVLLAAPRSQALPVIVTDRPVSATWPTLFNEALWDVDGNGSSEFRLWNSRCFFGDFLDLSSYNGGQGVVGFLSEPRQAIALSSGFVVGPTMEEFFNWRDRTNYRTLVGALGSIGTPSGFNYGFKEGPNFFGFRFGDPDTPNYGFATVNFGPLTGGARTVTISSWAYEAEPGESITVGPLEPAPEPVPGPIGLAGLAAGAAWTRRLRRRIRKSVAAARTSPAADDGQG
jgi:hypothetical protein